MLYANPSLYLNFNDATASFKEQISGLSFVGAKTIGTPLTIPNGQTVAADFNGSDNYGHVATSPMSTASVFTYAGWVYLPSASLGGCFFSNGTSTNDGAGSSGVWIGVGSATGNPGTGNYLNVLSSAVAWQFTGTTIGTGWHFIAVTRDGTTMRAYIDGTQTPTLTNSTATPIAPSGGVWMGQSSTSDKFPSAFAGYESGWQMYNVALTLAQIQALYAGGSAPSGLVGQWLLNEGTGSTILDTSGGGHNGTLYGTASGDIGYYEGAFTYTSGTVIPRQPGFDSTLANNTSAEFPWNGWNAAPNNTLESAMEWNTPWSMMVQVDNLQWNRTGTLVLASKGDLATNSYWELYLHMQATTLGDTGVQLSQLCFSRRSVASAPNIYTSVSNGICTSDNGLDIMPNGFNYNIIVTDSGTGASGLYSTTSALDIYVNGIDKTSAVAANPIHGKLSIWLWRRGHSLQRGHGLRQQHGIHVERRRSKLQCHGEPACIGRRSEWDQFYDRLRLHRRPNHHTDFAHRDGSHSDALAGRYFDELDQATR